MSSRDVSEQSDSFWSFFVCCSSCFLTTFVCVNLPSYRILLTDVGNKAAVFPLQLLGFEVDVVNSVHFSNHTGYVGGFEGDVLKGDQLRAILSGLERNGLLSDVGHLLTGYIGSESFLSAVLDVLATLRKERPVRFVCDPVLGDRGKFYVPEELVPLYREKVIPQADVLTPNQFEVEQLTGINIKSIDDALKACNVLHDMGPSLVFITSMELAAEVRDNSMTMLASQRTADATHVWRIDCPVFPGQFTGTGDLCASLLLAHTATCPDDLPAALEKVINTMHCVIARTYEHCGESVQSRELRLIQSKGDIENPPPQFKAERLL
jgi:pyridoxine kinase